jgi:hypothetical protein
MTIQSTDYTDYTEEEKFVRAPARNGNRPGAPQEHVARALSTEHIPACSVAGEWEDDRQIARHRYLAASPPGPPRWEDDW